MRSPDDAPHAALLIEGYDRTRPDLIALATAVALAVRVEPGLLRRARLDLTPGVGVAAEADLWFSPLVDFTSARGLVLRADVRSVLWRRLADDRARLDAAWALVRGLHRDAAPTLRLEEELLYSGLIDDADQVDELLERVLRTMNGDLPRAPGIARWVVRAVPEMPSAVRDSLLAHRLVAAAEMALGTPVRVGVRLIRRGVEISEPPVQGAPTLAIPPAPLRLEVRRLEGSSERVRTVDVVRGRVVRQTLPRAARGSDAVELITADGRVARLTSTGGTTPTEPERESAGARAAAFGPGDFILVADDDNPSSRLVGFGQRLWSRGTDRAYTKWTHAALIVDRGGGLIEAVGTGVRRWHLDRYRDAEYVVVHLDTTDENRDEVVGFAEWALRSRARYTRLSTVSTALAMLTGNKLAFLVDGQFTSSSLVAAALERTGSIFDRDAAHIAPADLARYFHVETLLSEPPGTTGEGSTPGREFEAGEQQPGGVSYRVSHASISRGPRT